MEMLFEDFVEVYFEDKDMELKERTKRNKRYMIDRHLIPFFKGMKMNEITPKDIINWQKTILEAGYSETYQRMVQNQVTALFVHANKIYDLHQNPCKKTRKIGRSDVRRLEFWTKEEFDRFIATYDKDNKYWLIFSILFWTGCRIGELLALTPNDFNFTTRTMYINKTFYRVDGRDVITKPKTDESTREVKIPQFLSDCVKSYIDRHYELPRNERLFPIVQEAVQHQLRDHIVMAEVPKISVHGLRHSAASFLISQGVQPVIIKERLGHKDIKITLNTYGHLYPNAHSDIVDMMDSVYQKSSAETSQQSKLTDEE